MITIDGSSGEGGGQILRTSLSLSLITGKPVHITNIRAARKKPGLLHQHLTAVTASATISRGTCHGAELYSSDLFFQPGEIMSGRYRFSVGTAGSASLVLQTILPALMTGERDSVLTLEGGTHNPKAPPSDFLHHVFLKIIATMGPVARLMIRQYGFYPAGGGEFCVRITPARTLKPITLLERGNIKNISVRAISSRLPSRIAEKEVEIILNKLGLKKDAGSAEDVQSPGPGNAVMIRIESENITELFTAFGRKGLPLEKVSGNVLSQAEQYLEHDVPVGVYLADQLLLPYALAVDAGTTEICRFRTFTPSSHMKTNCQVIQQFLTANISFYQWRDDVWEVEITSGEK